MSIDVEETLLYMTNFGRSRVPSRIVIDSNEPEWVDDIIRAAVSKEFTKEDVVIKRQRLQVADYIVGNVPVERKTVKDWYASVIDGRLENQLYELSANFPMSFLLIIPQSSSFKNDLFSVLHSTYRDKNKAFRRQLQFLKMFTSVMVTGVFKRSPTGKRGIVVTHVLPEEDMMGDYIVSLLKYQVSDVGFRVPKLFIKRNDEINLTATMLTAIPGVGVHRATIIANEFGTIENLLKASPDQLSKIAGVGPLTAARVMEALKNGTIS